MRLQLLIVEKSTNMLLPTDENSFLTSSAAIDFIRSRDRYLSSAPLPMIAVQSTASMYSIMKTKVKTQKRPCKACITPCSSSCSEGTMRVRRRKRISQSNLATVPRVGPSLCAKSGDSSESMTRTPHWSTVQPTTATMSREQNSCSSLSVKLMPWFRRDIRRTCSKRENANTKCLAKSCQSGVSSPFSMPKSRALVKIATLTIT
mmetsp:Transcript_106998/g.271649  ORF Transcript_106998/g.271649 Transcript_106998/m.271649 type:complete len:204 (-) Transcript_106998:633-1244(-)